ncbi:MAG: AI-2E family transporter [Thermodesulfovibrionales bacterium]
MSANRFYITTSIFLIIFLGYLSYQILQPFIVPIAWAVVFAVVFYPVYLYLLKYMRFKALASFITILIIILMILGPFTYISFVLVDEIGNFVTDFSKEKLDSIIHIFKHSHFFQVIEKIQSYAGVEGVGSSDAITESIKKIGATVTTSLSTGITNMAGMFIDFILMLFAVFFFFKDGPDFLTKVRDYLPFSEADKNRLISKIKDMVISTVYGGVVIAFAQGVLGGAAFYFLGIKSPVLWGSAMTVMSFVPLIGTFAIWGPAAGYLIIQGSFWKGVILILYGVLVISMVDNVLRPIIISGRTKMPTLAVLFSVLGGIKLFGFIGFIMGPLVLALFISVFEIFRHIEGGENA